jgi:hypothetical protein
MKGYVAVRRVRKACYELSGSIQDNMPYDAYHSLLRRMAKSKFASNGFADSMEHVMHWILFDTAGMEVDYSGNWERSVAIIKKDRFKRKLIEDGVSEYKDFIEANAK